jgi:hypothetical protein
MYHGHPSDVWWLTKDKQRIPYNYKCDANSIMAQQ